MKSLIIVILFLTSIALFIYGNPFSQIFRNNKNFLRNLGILHILMGVIGLISVFINIRHNTILLKCLYFVMIISYILVIVIGCFYIWKNLQVYKDKKKERG